jgi:hypothetical protein
MRAGFAGLAESDGWRVAAGLVARMLRHVTRACSSGRRLKPAVTAIRAVFRDDGAYPHRLKVEFGRVIGVAYSLGMVIAAARPERRMSALAALVHCSAGVSTVQM